MRELRVDELDMVSGAGLLTGLGELLGDILVGQGLQAAGNNGSTAPVQGAATGLLLYDNPVSILLGGLLFSSELGSSTLPPGLQGPLPAGHLPIGGHGPEIIFGPLPSGSLPGLQ